LVNGFIAFSESLAIEQQFRATSSLAEEALQKKNRKSMTAA